LKERGVGFDLAKALSLLPVGRFRDPAPVVAVLRLAGIIGRVGPVRRGLALSALAAGIERAFKLRRLKAVALAVNSPGGSPVQAALIAGRIRQLADEKAVPVFAFAEDVAASGGYWLALAADEIYADANSIVGSIGVVSAGFGFNELLKRLGVERRLHAAGEKKAMLDPFLREKPEDVERLQAIQRDVHESFREMVRRRRGDRLKAPEETLFSGEFWSGRRALDLGLVDGIGDLRTVMRRRFGERVRLRPVERREPWWRSRLAAPVSAGGGWGARAPSEWALELMAAVEERLLWSRFGL
jgi:signal peptide peptidase SppA